MPRGRDGLFWARVLLGAALGVVLVVTGLAMIRRTGGAGGSLDGYRVWLGATGVAAGLVWFMVVVADRICPLSRRGLVDLTEGVLMLVLVLGLAWSARIYMEGPHG